MFSFTNFYFTLLAAMTVVPAILVVFTANIVRAACWLLLSLTGAAGLFFYLNAEFVGAIQLLIYVGGTLVLVIFGVMLTATGPFVNLASRSGDWVAALVVGIGLFAVLAFGLTQKDFDPVQVGVFSPASTAENPAASPTTNRIGLAFLGISKERPLPARGSPSDKLASPKSPVIGYLLPFEIVSVHLVVVLIGAAYLARAKRRRVEGVANA